LSLISFGFQIDRAYKSRAPFDGDLAAKREEPSTVRGKSSFLRPQHQTAIWLPTIPEHKGIFVDAQVSLCKSASSAQQLPDFQQRIRPIRTQRLERRSGSMCRWRANPTADLNNCFCAAEKVEVAATAGFVLKRRQRGLWLAGSKSVRFLPERFAKRAWIDVILQGDAGPPAGNCSVEKKNCSDRCGRRLAGSRSTEGFVSSPPSDAPRALVRVSSEGVAKRSLLEAQNAAQLLLRSLMRGLGAVGVANEIEKPKISPPSARPVGRAFRNMLIGYG
jgi:hypothetical protein